MENLNVIMLYMKYIFHIFLLQVILYVSYPKCFLVNISLIMNTFRSESARSFMIHVTLRSHKVYYES